ncbi:MAG: hypothetical protein ACYS30_16995 [Planctomycetota bacterium]
MSVATETKKALHERFWRGEGPSLILIPAGDIPLYDTTNYRARFYDPARMWESEMERAKRALDWPTDGIPTVRPNLGTIFVPALGGQKYLVQDDQMPWVLEALTKEAIRASGNISVADSEVMQLAAEFYHIHAKSIEDGVVAYHPDTQGVFDVAHLLCGEDIFLDLMDSSKEGWLDELLEISLQLIIRATRYVKDLLGEPDEVMVHGHGTPQGVYFPKAGIRLSEDTATLISPKSIERYVLPMIETAASFFGGAFVHYCGLHGAFFEMLCQMPCVKAIDLGDPHMYDTRWLMERCAETNTILYSRLAPEPDEQWQSYICRLGRLVHETGVRCILRPLLYPRTRRECSKMKEMWHDLTF